MPKKREKERRESGLGAALREQVRARLRGWWEEAGRPPQHEVGAACEWDQRSVSAFFKDGGIPITLERACLMAHYFGYTMADVVTTMKPATDPRLARLSHGFLRIDPERQSAVLSLVEALPGSQQRVAVGSPQTRAGARKAG